MLSSLKWYERRGVTLCSGMSTHPEEDDDDALPADPAELVDRPVERLRREMLEQVARHRPVVGLVGGRDVLDVAPTEVHVGKHLLAFATFASVRSNPV